MRKLLAALLFTAGCSSAAYADQPINAGPAAIGPQIAIASAPAKVRAPYDVQIIRENGDVLSTYAQKDRFYVQGNANERYIIRVTNPTPNRVEAVITVDGLDVVDGDAGDLHKRGYVIPPYGETRIEGFRTSSNDVATFRFSSVNDSYAGKKGVPRNVGVIAAAIFEETAEAQQQIVAPAPVPSPYHNYNYEDDLDGAGADVSSVRGERPASPPRHAMKKDAGRDRVSTADKAPAAPTASRPAPPPQNVNGAGGAPMKNYRPPADEEMAPPEMQRQREPGRPGLGTEFGEQRTSSVSFTKFVRNSNRPIAIAELRYNDAAGLMALGIPVQPMPDSGEIMTRETADPFPGDVRFSRAPR